MVSGSNVALQVVRRGRLGVVSVSWATAGLPGNSNGDITPPTGSILLGPQERSSTINLTVRHTPSCVIYFSLLMSMRFYFCKHFDDIVEHNTLSYKS